MPAQKKIDQVEKLNKVVSKSKTIVVSDHTGLTHKQFESLRKKVKKAGGNFLVTKNTLLKKAFNKTPFDGKIDDNALTGPTSVLLSIDDEVSPIKELFTAIAEFNLPKVKGGATSKNSLTIEDIITLSKIPSREILLGQLLGLVKSPQTRLVFTLKGNLIKMVLVLKALHQKKVNAN